MFHHLENDHQITISSKTVADSTKSIQKYFSSERVVSAGNPSQKKFILIRDFVLLCCRDLLPFRLVDGPGLQDFLEVGCSRKFNYFIFSQPKVQLQKYKVAFKDELPCRTSISRALSSVYDDCKTWLVDYLKTNCPDTISITFDLWTCKYRRRSYITLTLHYVSSSFELVDITLSTSHFPDSHKGVNILPRIESILDSYGLADKNIIFVTDGGEVLICRPSKTRKKQFVVSGSDI